MLEGESFISLALAWSAFLHHLDKASDLSRPSILASYWPHCSPFSGANQADSPQRRDNSGVQVMTGSIVHCLHTTQFLFTIRQISTMRLHCQSQTTFREQRPSLTKSVMNCPQTQASLHKAEETFILDFQRHPSQSQCDGGQRQVSPILHHQFYHFSKNWMISGIWVFRPRGQRHRVLLCLCLARHQEFWPVSALVNWRQGL